MFKPFSLIFFVAVFAWLIRIFLVTDGTERIARTCQPVELGGNLMVSATALLADQFTPDMQQLMEKWVFGCRYMVWRSVYEQDYLAYTRSDNVAQEKRR